LVEIFALRKPFINLVTPGVPILTPGIIELIGEKRSAKTLYGAGGGELRNWLALRQHDLIEEAIKKLLKCIIEGEECKELGDALRPWKIRGVMETLMEVSKKVSDVDSAVKYFTSNYGEKLTNTLKVFSNECWRKAALIIGYALTWHPIVPMLEDLPESLNRCGVDDYLLVGNVIPLFIMMVLAYTLAFALALALIDRYNEAIGELNRIFNIVMGKRISDAESLYGESLYGLGLASILANATRLGRDVKPSDADIALRVTSVAIKSVPLPILIMLILIALEPLRDKAPHRYLRLLALALNTENLDPITVRYVFDKLNEILDKYGDVVKEHAWSLVHAINAYADLLGKHLKHFNSEEVGDMVSRVVDLLNELGRFESSLGLIAWADALASALKYEDVRRLMEEKLGIDVIGKASEILKELNDKKNRVQELMSDEEFRSYIESSSVKADEEAVKIVILGAASFLRHALAFYRLDNDELDEAEKLFYEVAEERRESGGYQNYLIARGWALRAEAIKGSLAGKELVDGFKQLYEEAFNEERFSIPTADYLSTASARLSDYLVSLALAGDHETINKLLEEHWWVLNAVSRASVLTRLMLDALLSPRGGLSSELEGKLSVNPEELINAFEYDMHREFLPALRVAFKMKSPEEEYDECKSIKDSTERRDCEDAVSAVMDDSVAICWLRGKLINYFYKLILENERSGWFRKLGFDAKAMISEFEKLVYGLDGKSLAQLLAIHSSAAQLALMLRALINGNRELAKALALYGAIYFPSKLLRRLYLEAYKECKECCDLKNESFRHAIARLFLLHV